MFFFHQSSSSFAIFYYVDAHIITQWKCAIISVSQLILQCHKNIVSSIGGKDETLYEPLRMIYYHLMAHRSVVGETSGLIIQCSW